MSTVFRVFTGKTLYCPVVYHMVLFLVSIIWNCLVIYHMVLFLVSSHLAMLGRVLVLGGRGQGVRVSGGQEGEQGNTGSLPERKTSQNWTYPKKGEGVLQKSKSIFELVSCVS